MRGSFGRTCDYEERSFDGEDWVEGECEQVLPISYAAFYSFWHMHYPKLKICSPSYDTYTLCFKYTCSFSSIICEAKEVSVLLKDVIVSEDDDDYRKNNGKNEREEVDDTLIN